MEDPKEDKETKEISKTPTWDYNDRGQFRYLKQCHDNLKSYSPMNIALESDFVFWTSQVKQVLRKLESLEAENSRLRSEISSLAARISEVEGDNLSLRKMIQESKEQESSHPPNEALHTEIQDFKTNQEEIIS